MEYIEKKIGEDTYTFEVEYVNCRDGFSHTCELYKNGGYRPLATNRVHYINRTWESYEFQTVMLGCVRMMMERIMAKGIDEYKEANGIKRLIAKKREEVETAIKKSREYAELQMLYDLVANAHYGTEKEKERLENLDKLLKMTEALAELGFFGHKTA